MKNTTHLFWGVEGKFKHICKDQFLIGSCALKQKDFVTVQQSRKIMTNIPNINKCLHFMSY